MLLSRIVPSAVLGLISALAMPAMANAAPLDAVAVVRHATLINQLIMAALLAASVGGAVVCGRKLAAGPRLAGGSLFLSGLRFGGPLAGLLGAAAVVHRHVQPADRAQPACPGSRARGMHDADRARALRRGHRDHGELGGGSADRSGGAAAMRGAVHVTEAEGELLEALWRCGPLPPAALVAEVQKARSWGRATIKTLLARLMHKRVVLSQRDDGALRYHAMVAREAFVESEVQALADRLFGGDFAKLAAFAAERVGGG
jgi:predicted transcriptional regulator